MKKLQTKQKILLFLSLIFLISSVSISAYKTVTNFKDISFNKNIDDNVKVKKINDLENEKEIKNRILALVETLGEAVDYMKNNLNEEKLTEAISMTEDCIKALDSIENGLNKLSSKDKINSLNKQTQILKAYFYDFKSNLGKGDLEKSLDIISSIQKEYIHWKKQIKGFLI
ncbi:hypothetical protein CLLI_08860 [Clostridium liquoris]|jgi:hypothetical protein|uniref:DUF8042 domain-containing protein n=1 Tax=Clostridium liquoris TaxID=1289519 RepID=A0A2T0B698_9CLOT|nr:hypothetical protein [Clostridium liquoris]PRR79406.1 hypothetical protein CLLI_08860 [Clostridium liquoris]